MASAGDEPVRLAGAPAVPAVWAAWAPALWAALAPVRMAALASPFLIPSFPLMAMAVRCGSPLIIFSHNLPLPLVMDWWDMSSFYPIPSSYHTSSIWNLGIL